MTDANTTDMHIDSHLYAGEVLSIGLKSQEGIGFGITTALGLEWTAISTEDAIAIATHILISRKDQLTEDMVRGISDELMPDAPAKPTKLGPPRYSNLSDQAQLVYRHMVRAGSISAREAMDDHGITSATLARRICDIEEEGFGVNRDRRVHPITGKRYTRYSLQPNYN